MITGADAITAMRKLDDIIRYAEDQTLPNLDSIADDLEGEVDYLYWKTDTIAEQIKDWRDEITKAGGIRPLQSYTELLSPGDTL